MLYKEIFLCLQVLVWGGISRKGPTPLLIFEGRMDSIFYQEKILKDQLIPFLQEKFPAGHRLMQDNDPKHVSASTREFMRQNNINWWPTPPESPDLNPIENVWHGLKLHLRKHVKPSNKEELIAGILEFWNSLLTPEMCGKYISHVHKVMPEVIVRWGAASGF